MTSTSGQRSAQQSKKNSNSPVSQNESLLYNQTGLSRGAGQSRNHHFVNNLTSKSPSVERKSLKMGSMKGMKTIQSQGKKEHTLNQQIIMKTKACMNSSR